MVRAEERERAEGGGLMLGNWAEISKGVFKSVRVFDEFEKGWK